MGAGVDQILLGRAFQVAQMAGALHWMVKTLRDGGFGLEEGLPTLGEWVAEPAAVSASLRSFESGGLWEERRQAGASAGPGGRLRSHLFLSPAGPAPWGAWPAPPDTGAKRG